MSILKKISPTRAAALKDPRNATGACAHYVDTSPVYF